MESETRGSRRVFFALSEPSPHTDIPLTHSIGLYDNAIYVSELCIDHSSSNCPSFSPPPGPKSHSLFLAELKQLLKESRLIDGSAHARLLGGLE